jgi:hypothetical protein
MREMAGWMDEVPIAVTLTTVRGDETTKAGAPGGETVKVASTSVLGDETIKADVLRGETVKDGSMTANEETTPGVDVSDAVIVPSAHSDNIRMKLPPACTVVSSSFDMVAAVGELFVS